MTPYMMLVNIKNPRPEHARLMTALKTISPDPKAAYFDKNGGAFFFNSERPLRDISNRVFDLVGNEDQYLIVELGQSWVTLGLGSAAGWLRHHLGNAAS
jgi:hypothetical protein